MKRKRERERERIYIEREKEREREEVGPQPVNSGVSTPVRGVML